MTTTNDTMFGMIKELVRLTADSSVRSNKRTNYAHTELGKMVVEWNPRLTFKIEHAIKTSLGSYRVDIVLFNKDTHEPVAFIPCKFSMSNIKQNLTNGQNSVMGEIRKMNSVHPNVPIFTLNIYPKQAPYFNKDGTMKERLETYNVDMYKKQAQDTIKMARDNPADAAFVFFVNNTYKSKKDIVCESVADFTDLEKFKSTIETLVPV